jgi:hypothetical protein
MINYSGLPQRTRRIVKQYEYCIESVDRVNPDLFNVILKDGYESGSGFPTVLIRTDKIEEAIYLLKAVTKPKVRKVCNTLFGFSCPMCQRYIPRGTNHIDLGGLKVCNGCASCNSQDNT